MTTLVSKLILYIKTLAHHLWLSVSSMRFYQEVFTSYRGYGIKYIFTLSGISSLLCCIILLFLTNNIQNYLSNDVVTPSVRDIDNVIRQLPAISYNGREIELDDDSVVFIYNDNTKLLAIDPAGKLSYSERIQIPIILLKDQININFSNIEEKVRNKLPIKYTQVFGPEPQILTKETVKSKLASNFERAPNVVIYLGFPILTIMLFINTLIDKSLMIIFIFLISLLGKKKANLNDVVRVVLFSSGFYTLFGFVISVTFIELRYLLGLIQIWANILMIIGILKSQGRLPPWVGLIKRR